MANDIDANVYPDNNDLIVYRPTERTVNATTGEVEEAAVVGMSVKYYLAATADAESHADAITGLSIDLTEGPSGVYVGTMLGSAKRTNLAATLDETELHRHWQDGTVHHVTTPVTYRTRRPVEDDA